jgi:hypothetical protein
MLVVPKPQHREQITPMVTELPFASFGAWGASFACYTFTEAASEACIRLPGALSQAPLTQQTGVFADRYVLARCRRGVPVA